MYNVSWVKHFVNTRIWDRRFVSYRWILSNVPEVAISENFSVVSSEKAFTSKPKISLNLEMLTHLPHHPQKRPFEQIKADWGLIIRIFPDYYSPK